MDIQVNNLLKDAILEVVSQKLTSYREAQKKIVCVFTGAKIGCKEAVAALAPLKEQGYTFKVLLSYQAAQILDVEVIDSLLLPEELWIEKAPMSHLELAREAGLVVVPTMSANTCAHVANLLSDTAAQGVIIEALSAGIPVVSAIDGCCPDNAHRKELGYKLPLALAQKMKNNQDMLREMGLTFTTAQKLGHKILRVQERELLGQVWSLVSGIDSELFQGKSQNMEAGFNTSASASAITYTGSKVLDAGYVRSLPQKSTLLVPASTIVTQLAQDIARSRNITLIKDGK